MSDVRLTSDVVVLDSALQSSYSQHVLEGNHLISSMEHISNATNSDWR